MYYLVYKERWGYNVYQEEYCYHYIEVTLYMYTFPQ